MFAVRLLQKVKNHHNSQHNMEHGNVPPRNLDPHIAHHYGVPSTSSVLAFDPIQRLLAVGTLDGRIKVIGGDNVEGLLISPKQLPYKNLEFLNNQGFLVSVSNENDIQVWDLEQRRITCSLKWECNTTDFSVIPGTSFMYVGDEYGLVSVLKYDSEEGKILQLPYHIPASSLADAAEVSLPNHISVVGVLPQPCTSGNRLLIAYENGLIILWDVSEARVVLVRGYNDLKLKEGGMSNQISEDTSELEQEEKEISSLCWASSDGSVLAAGYVDGDIMLWNMLSGSSSKGHKAGMSANDVVKLQLSSGERKIPVIVLHWSAVSGSNSDRGGQLFIYGGDDIGSEEVLTVLSLEWSPGREALRCVNRVDLTLNGSFADMILVPNAGSTENNTTSALFILTNPGQLHVYDDASLSTFLSQQEKIPARAMAFPVAVPILEPCMTVAKLISVPMGGNASKALLEIASSLKTGVTPSLAIGTKWPLTGGIPRVVSSSEREGVGRLYMAGYQDGSVRVWDATYPVLSPLIVLEGEVRNMDVAGASTPVSALDFSFLTTSLAVGSECGLVRIYKLGGHNAETSFHYVSETKHEVHKLHQEKELQCTAAYCILSSPVRTLQYASSGGQLAVGFECNRVAMLDMSSSSVLFLTDCLSGSSSPIISIDFTKFTDISSMVNSSKDKEPDSREDPANGEIFVLTKGSDIFVVDKVNGSTISSWTRHHKKESTTISFYIVDSSSSDEEVISKEQSEQLFKNNTTHSGVGNDGTLSEVDHQGEFESCTGSKSSGKKSADSLVLLCCEDALHVYSLKSVIQGENKSIHKVKLANPCCWTSTFKKPNERACGLILLYQTGVIEIRSLPDLKIMGESSLMSIIRWSFKTNMDKTTSSSDNGQIAMANGSELAFISFVASESDSRYLDSLPCLHDKVVAAAADAAISFSSSHKKKQGSPGILGGIMKGFKGEKDRQTMEHTIPSNLNQHLESAFARVPFAYPNLDFIDDLEADLSIDDIEIDEPVPIASTSSSKSKNEKKDKETDREKLLQGATTEKPRMRTAEEIRAKYRHAGDASAAAGEARDKLIERQEKLERIRRNTEELQSGAENFASMANELVKTMEGRKWWNI